MDKKIHISIQGVITKNSQKEFTEKEYDQMTDDIIEVIENHDCSFGGGIGHHTEEEYCKMLDESN